MKSDIILVQHIQDAIERVEKFIKRMRYQEFETDEKTISAVVRELIVIGEAVGSLSIEFQKKYPEIPFYEINGMRNRIVHEYWAVDDEIVWKTCCEDIPQLKKSLEKISKRK